MNREQIILLGKKSLRSLRAKKYGRVTIDKIAVMCGVSITTIRDRLKRYKIK